MGTSPPHVCGKCGTEIQGDLLFCRKCGTKAGLNSMPLWGYRAGFAAPQICGQCDAEIPSEMIFCNNCGSKDRALPLKMPSGHAAAFANARICGHCGSEISYELFFCDSCGAKADAVVASAHRSHKTVHTSRTQASATPNPHSVPPTAPPPPDPHSAPQPSSAKSSDGDYAITFKREYQFFTALSDVEIFMNGDGYGKLAAGQSATYKVNAPIVEIVITAWSFTPIKASLRLGENTTVPFRIQLGSLKLAFGPISGAEVLQIA